MLQYPYDHGLSGNIQVSPLFLLGPYCEPPLNDFNQICILLYKIIRILCFSFSMLCMFAHHNISNMLAILKCSLLNDLSLKHNYQQELIYFLCIFKHKLCKFALLLFVHGQITNVIYCCTPAPWLIKMVTVLFFCLNVDCLFLFRSRKIIWFYLSLYQPNPTLLKSGQIYVSRQKTELHIVTISFNNRVNILATRAII